jgi:P27 family predicted phage terminase small subunit
MNSPGDPLIVDDDRSDPPNVRDHRGRYMPGPPPLPAEQHRRRGSPSRKRLPNSRDVIPLAPADAPPPTPASLAETGQKAWDRIWTAGAAWLAPATDSAIVTRLCEGYDLRERMRQQLNADGFMVKGSKSQQRTHPILDKLLALEALLTRYEGLCGFTPADRARLGVAEVRRPDARRLLHQATRGTLTPALRAS